MVEEKLVEEKIEELGYELPVPWDLPPGFGFKSILVHNNTAYVSGSMPFVDGKLPYQGKVGDTVTIEQGQELARVCILNSLASLKKEIGSLDKVEQVLKIIGFVASAPGFTDQALVMNAATDLLVDIFGESGKHSRTAVGTAVMPENTPLEIEMVIALKK